MMFILSLAILVMPGCSGCNQETDEQRQTRLDEEKKEKLKEKPKPDFESLTAVTQPGYYPLEQEERKRIEKEALRKIDSDNDDGPNLLEQLDPAMRFNRTKRGHWISVDLRAIANNFDANGYLATGSFYQNQPVPIEQTDYFLDTRRPVSLSKSQWKTLETSVFLPRIQADTTTTTIDFEFNRGSGTGIPMISKMEPVKVMSDFQYHMVVLSTTPDAFKFLAFMDSIRLRTESSVSQSPPEFYFVVPTIDGKPVPLPRHSMNWTTIAYLLWDDLDPDSLDLDQQRALVDWLHFGGQLIISGPDSLDRLQASFLAEHLPARFDGTGVATESDIEELNDFWSIDGDSKLSKQIRISDKSPLPIIRFDPHLESAFVNNSSEMLIERRVGRGRVVATAFSFSAAPLRQWHGFQSFFHNAILRKPARTFGKSEIGNTTFHYSDDGTSIFDPMPGSTLRYLSRDLQDGSENAFDVQQNLVMEDMSSLYTNSFDAGINMDLGDFYLPSKKSPRTAEDYFHHGGFDVTRQSGTAGWTDHSAIANAARFTLKEGAGISPPSANLIAWMLAGYLFVLVPVNWLVFRLMGRVEWAWIAAPIIAVAGAFAVIRMASLDIGFVRSLSQASVLEIHAGHDRGHLSDYSALYTSLSTGYRVSLDDAGTLALPFAKKSSGRFKSEAPPTAVVLEQGPGPQLTDYQVQSNSTGLMHSETMLDLEGSVSVDDRTLPPEQWTVRNDSLLNLADAGIVYRDNDGDYHTAWLGKIAAGSSAPPLSFDDVAADSIQTPWLRSPDMFSGEAAGEQVWINAGFADDQIVSISELAGVESLSERWLEYKSALRTRPSDNSQMEASIDKKRFTEVFSRLNRTGINVSRLFDCVIDHLQLGPGEARLIAQTRQPLGRTKFEPAATQIDRQTLVVVHLRPANLPDAKPDANAFADFKR